MKSGPTASPRRARLNPPSELTTREAEVYECAANGMSNAEIAAALFISEATAKTHMRNILAKLGLTSRSKLMAQARDTGTKDAPDQRARPVTSGSTTRGARVVAASGAVVAAVTAAVLVAAPWASPAASSQPFNRAVSGLSVLPFIAEVEPIADLPVRAGEPMSWYLDEGPGPEPVVADITYLGSRDLYFGVGALSDSGRVCLNLSVLDPESNPTVSGRRVCTGFAEFTHSGLLIDMGAWALTWHADGTVNWGGN